MMENKVNLTWSLILILIGRVSSGNMTCADIWNCRWTERLDPSVNHEGYCVLWEQDDPFFRASLPPPFDGGIDIDVRCSRGTHTPDTQLFECMKNMTDTSLITIERLTIYACNYLEIHESDLAAFPSLSTLEIRYGSLGYISPRALCGSISLSFLDFYVDAIADNITSPYPEAFIGNTCNNDQTLAAGNLHSGETFLPMLQEMSLSNFQFSEPIPENAFQNLLHLQILHLSFISFSSNETFMSLDVLSNLESLQINHPTSYINLDFFFGNVLPKLQNLKKLWLLETNIKTLSSVRDVFSNNPLIEEISFFWNKLSFIHELTFRNLSNLRSLDLAVNKNLTSLQHDFLRGLINLEELILKDCSLKSLNEVDFSDVTSLKTLSAEKNDITEIPNIFSNFPEQDVVLSRIQTIKLQSNNIKCVKLFTFSNLAHLSEIDLSLNLISSVDDKAFYNLENIESINLAGNRLAVISPKSLFNLQGLYLLDLKDNMLTYFPTFPCNVNSRLGLNGLPSIRVLTDLRRNNLQCDCSMFEFLYHFIAFGFTEGCSLPSLYDREKYWPGVHYLVNQRFHQAELLCNNPRGFFYIEDILNEPSLFLSDISNTSYFSCPRGCRCIRACQESVNIVSCRNQSFTDIPSDLDESTEILFLQNNRIESIPKSSLDVVPNLQYLNLHDNRVNHIEKGSLDQLLDVDLSDNRLTELPRGTMMSLSLKNLNFSKNDISSLYAASFAGLPFLEILDLSHNEITVFPSGLFDNLTKLTSVFIGGNPLNCTCDMLYLSKWYRQASFKPNGTRPDTDFGQIECVPFANGTQLSKWIDDHETSCLSVSEEPVVVTGSNSALVSVLLIIITILTVVFITTLVIYRYHLEFSVMVYARTGFRCFQISREDESSKDFDAFISFSNQDNDFVLNDILPRLENHSPPWKLCIHHRDFAVGESIATNILNAIERSKRTIIILSTQFLESEWCSYEFRAAHSQALRERSQKILLVMFNDVDKSTLDKELKAYISTNTYLRTDDTMFWSKLKYALPEPINSTEESTL